MSIIKRWINNYKYRKYNLESTKFYIIDYATINPIDNCDRCGIKLPIDDLSDIKIIINGVDKRTHLKLCNSCIKNICKNKV